MSRFKINDHVRLVDDLGPRKDHFPGAGGEAIVLGRSNDDYSLYVRGYGEVSWYQGPQLGLIKHQQKHLIATWKSTGIAETADPLSDRDFLAKHLKLFISGKRGVANNNNLNICHDDGGNLEICAVDREIECDDYDDMFQNLGRDDAVELLSAIENKVEILPTYYEHPVTRNKGE